GVHTFVPKFPASAPSADPMSKFIRVDRCATTRAIRSRCAMSLGAIPILLWTLVAPAAAADVAEEQLQRELAGKVQPFVKKYCSDCHGAENQEAKLDLTAFSTLDQVIDGHRKWDTVLRRLESREMPPEESKQPTADERKAVAEWIRELRRHASQRNAGDPGRV